MKNYFKKRLFKKEALKREHPKIHDHKPPYHQESRESELINYLEPDQLTEDRSQPLPRIIFSKPLQIFLWIMRIVVLLLSAMVIYTFINNLP